MANLFRPLGYLFDSVGKNLGLPELGISEKFGVTQGVPISKSDGKFVNNGYPGISAGQALGGGGGAANGGGGYSGGGGGGRAAAAYDPNTDPNQVANMRNSINPLLGQMDSVYNMIFGKYDQYAQDARNRLDGQYNQMFSEQDKQLENAQNQTVNAFAARGSANSSANAMAQGQNVDAYNTQRQTSLSDRDTKYADLGRTVGGAKSKLQQSRPQFDLGQYNDVNTLTQVRDQLNQHIQGLSQQAAEIGPESQFVQQLNSMAPQASNLQAELATKLSALAKSSAPASAKNAIAKGYIKLAGADDNYWNNYFMNLLGGPQDPQQVA